MSVCGSLRLQSGCGFVMMVKGDGEIGRKGGCGELALLPVDLLCGPHLVQAREPEKEGEKKS